MAGSEGGSGHRDSGDLERHYVAQRGELTAPSRYCIGCHGGRQDRLLRRRPRDDFPDRVNDGTVSTEVNAALQTSADHLETAPTSSSAPISGAASAGHSPNLSRVYEVTPPLEGTSPARLATPPPLLTAA